MTALKVNTLSEKSFRKCTKGLRKTSVERKGVLGKNIYKFMDKQLGWSGSWEEKDWQIGKKGETVNGSIMYQSCFL